jgi:Fic family protein
MDLTHLPVSEETVLELHQLARGQIWDAGKYKGKDGDIIERYADGHERVRFHPVSAAGTPAAMTELVADWRHCLDDRWVHPLIAMAAFNLDFLCIHPFRDGNGRVSRLVLLLQFYQLGYEAGRYISLERLIEENKDRYYETLEKSSQGWHEGKHDPWPYINYVLSILKLAYREFAERVGEVKAPRGSKTDLVLTAISRFTDEFTVSQLEQTCHGVSKDMIRRVLREQQNAMMVECQGRGPAARWKRKG